MEVSIGPQILLAFLKERMYCTSVSLSVCLSLWLSNQSDFSKLFRLILKAAPPHNGLDLGVTWSDFSFALNKTEFSLGNSGESLVPF